MISEHPEAREALDEIIGKIRSGRLTRRSFLERAMAVGLSSTAAVSLLEACGGVVDPVAVVVPQVLSGRLKMIPRVPIRQL